MTWTLTEIRDAIITSSIAAGILWVVMEAMK